MSGVLDVPPGEAVAMLANKVVLVTGAGRGIGRAIAIAFAREGCKVACVSRTLAQVEETAELARGEGSELPDRIVGPTNAPDPSTLLRAGRSVGPTRAIALEGDVASEESVADFVAEATRQLGEIDILINNAGAFALSSVAETTIEDWDHIMGVNARGVFLCAKAVLPAMIARQDGCIINIASMAALKPYPNQSAYCASKHAVLGFSKVLADEMREHNVRVTAICPGGVDTDMVRAQRPDWEPEMLMAPEDVAGAAVFVAKLSPRAAIDVLPMRRWAASPT